MEEEKNEEILKVKISFNKSEKDEVNLPSSYDSFINEIKKLYDLKLNSNISLTYKDEDQDSININSKENYSTFIEQITNNEVEAKVYIKVKEEQNMKRTNVIKKLIESKENNNENYLVKNEINIVNNNNIINNINITINNVKENNDKKIDNNNNIIDFNKLYLIFPQECTICSSFPIVDVFYYCLICSFGICKNCENDPNIKINHDDHTFLKIQTEEQYLDLAKKLFNKKNSDKIYSNKKKFYNKLFNSKNGEKLTKMNLIQIARSFYDFKNISDEKLKEVLNRENGHIKKTQYFLKTNKKI